MPPRIIPPGSRRSPAARSVDAFRELHLRAPTPPASLSRDALVAKAREGVAVRLLYDWLGCLRPSASAAFWQRLRAAGVEVRCFNPPRLDSPFGWLSRNHRKIAHRRRRGRLRRRAVRGRPRGWATRRAGVPPWRDTGVSCAARRSPNSKRRSPQSWALCRARHCPPASAGRRARSRRRGRRVAARDRQPAEHDGACTARSARSPPLARRPLWLTDAYFVGTTAYVQALIDAARDGVDVRLLVPGAQRHPGRQGAVARRLPAAARGRHPRVRVERPDAARQDRGGGRQLGAGRLDQPQHGELGGQLGAGRRGRGRRVRRPDGGDVRAPTSTNATEIVLEPRQRPCRAAVARAPPGAARQPGAGRRRRASGSAARSARRSPTGARSGPAEARVMAAAGGVLLIVAGRGDPAAPPGHGAPCARHALGRRHAAGPRMAASHQGAIKLSSRYLSVLCYQSHMLSQALGSDPGQIGVPQTFFP